MHTFDFIYYCDSYPAIGNGHLKRCMDTLHSITRSDVNVSIAIMGVFSLSARKFLEIMNTKHFPVLTPGEKKKISAKVSILDTLAAPGDVDTIDAKKANFLKNISRKLFVINTGYKTHIPECVDAIINYVPITQYSGNLSVEKYYGLDYAPVSSEFLTENNRSGYDCEYDVFAVIGGSDNQYGPGILSNALKKYVDKRVGILVSPHFNREEYEGLVQRYPTVKFFQNIDSVGEMMQKSKAVICTYGNTTYESMAVKKPTFIVSYLDFQFKFAEYLEKIGLAVNLGYLRNLRSDISIVFDREAHSMLTENCKKKFTSSGIDNIAKAILRSIHEL